MRQLAIRKYRLSILQSLWVRISTPFYGISFHVAVNVYHFICICSFLEFAWCVSILLHLCVDPPNPRPGYHVIYARFIQSQITWGAFCFAHFYGRYWCFASQGSGHSPSWMATKCSGSSLNASERGICRAPLIGIGYFLINLWKNIWVQIVVS